jgi:hypothetical protein
MEAVRRATVKTLMARWMAVVPTSEVERLPSLRR